MESKKVTLGLLVFYLAVLTWIIVFKMQFSFGNLGHMRSINLIPFGESVIINGEMDFNEIINNVLAFVPFGVLAHVLWEGKPLFMEVAPIVLTSLLFETLQYMLAVGMSDITDLITNSLGGAAGIGIAFAISKIFRGNWKKVINIVSLGCAAMLALLVAVLVVANW